MDGSIQLPDDSILAAMLMFCCSQKKMLMFWMDSMSPSDPIRSRAAQPQQTPSQRDLLACAVLFFFF